MTLKTVLNKVIVEPAEAETVTKGGIIIPDTALEKPQKVRLSQPARVKQTSLWS